MSAIFAIYMYAAVAAVGAFIGVWDAGTAVIVAALVMCTDFVTDRLKRGGSA
jgi:hypothetical protein